jgi:hypothetical protein
MVMSIDAWTPLPDVKVNDRGHVDAHNRLKLLVNQRVNVLDCGAKGDGVTDDTAAIQRAINAAAETGRNAEVYFPGGRQYRITKTINWLPGVRLVGGVGGLYVRSRRVEISWGGADSGVMFEVASGDNLHEHAAEGICWRGEGKVKSCVRFTSTGEATTDLGTEFYACQFAGGGADSVLLDYQDGVTNLYLANCRLDGWLGYAIRIRATGAGGGIIGLHRFTADNGGAGSKGFLWMDGEDVPNNNCPQINLSDCKIEINSPITEAVFHLGTTPTISNYVQYNVSMVSVQIANPVSVKPTLHFIKLSKPTDGVQLTGVNVHPGMSDQPTIITNSITPAPEFRRYPLVVFAPFHSGVPAAENRRAAIIAHTEFLDVGFRGGDTGKRNTLYVEDGALKFRGGNGTVTEIARA